MTEVAAGPVSPTAPPVGRGTLDVRVPVIAHTIERIVLDVDTVVRRSSRLGSSYPKASVQLHGAWASAEVEVAVVWPSVVTDVAQQVRDRVIDQVQPLVGVQIRTADVTVHVVPAEAGDRGPAGTRVS